MAHGLGTSPPVGLLAGIAMLCVPSACGDDTAVERGTCVQVVSGSSWWSLTEDLGLDPNTYWHRVRDENPGAQITGRPDEPLLGKRVCANASLLDEIDAKNAETAADDGGTSSGTQPSDQVEGDNDGGADSGEGDSAGTGGCQTVFACFRYERPTVPTANTNSTGSTADESAADPDAAQEASSESAPPATEAPGDTDADGRTVGGEPGSVSEPGEEFEPQDDDDASERDQQIMPGRTGDANNPGGKFDLPVPPDPDYEAIPVLNGSTDDLLRAYNVFVDTGDASALVTTAATDCPSEPITFQLWAAFCFLADLERPEQPASSVLEHYTAQVAEIRLSPSDIEPLPQLLDQLQRKLE